jgi:hypothetical protein
MLNPTRSFVTLQRCALFDRVLLPVCRLFIYSIGYGAVKIAHFRITGMRHPHHLAQEMESPTGMDSDGICQTLQTINTKSSPFGRLLSVWGYSENYVGSPTCHIIAPNLTLFNTGKWVYSTKTFSVCA